MQYVVIRDEGQSSSRQPTLATKKQAAIHVLAMAESLVSCAWLQEHWMDKRDPNIVLLDGEQIIYEVISSCDV